MNWSDFLDLRQPPEFVIGSDEVGTGALAGPIVVTAVVYPFSWAGLPGLKDSKKYRSRSEKQRRREVAEDVYRSALTFDQQYIQVEDLDRDGMYPLLLTAHRRAIEACLAFYPDAFVIVDGNFKIPGVRFKAVPKADDLVPAVSAASVLGKVERDWWMGSYAAQKYPVYGFAHHVGYGSPEHYKALRQYGPCEIHRRSYKLSGRNSGSR